MAISTSTAPTDPDFRLATARLTLRPPVMEDAPAIHKLVNDWQVVRMLHLPFPYPRPLTEDWIASVAGQRAQGRGYHLVITGDENGTETLIGCVALRLDEEPRTAKLGYWVGTRYWGHGVASEAARRLISWGFASLPIERVVAHVAEDNAASAAVLRRIGMRQVGVGTGTFPARGPGEYPVLVFEAAREDIFGRVGTHDEEFGDNMLLVAACALIDIDNRVLLARRPEGKKMAGLWEFPGGKVARGETPEGALVRELKEELGIDVSQACLAPFAFASHAYPDFHLLMPLFLCRRWKGFVQPLEGQGLAWVRAEKLGEYDMPEADKPLVPLLRDFL